MMVVIIVMVVVMAATRERWREKVERVIENNENVILY